MSIVISFFILIIYSKQIEIGDIVCLNKCLLVIVMTISEASVADRPTLVSDTRAIKGEEDDKETCPRSSSS